MQYVVFDFDGPIFDGRQAAARALEKTAAHFESSFPRPGISFSDLPLLRSKNLISLLYPDVETSDRNLIWSFYKAQLDESERNLRVSETVHNALQALRKSGFSLAIYSGRQTDKLESLLHDIGISQYFTSVGGTPAFTKPSGDYFRNLAQTTGVQLSEALYVGDSDRDCAAAKDAGVEYYHAGWTQEPNANAGNKAKVVLESLEDLVGLLVSSPARVSDGGDVLKELFDAVQRNEFSFYGGAGISVPSGVGAWEQHYHNVLRHLSVGFMSSESDLPEVVQWLAANPTRAQRVYDAFKDSFKLYGVLPNAYHYAMLRSNATRIWTSNYDDLFEKAEYNGQFGTEIVTDDKKLLQSFKAAHLVIKMNGDFPNANFSNDLDWGLVFLQEHFDRAERDRPEIWRLFEDDYRQRCMIFAGLSFRDPVLRRILAVARQKIPRTRYRHYLITKKETDRAARAKQIMLAENLQRAFITTVFMDSYPEVLDLVQQVALAAYRPIVGFSGGVGRVENEDTDKSVIYDGMSLTAGEIGEACRSLGAQLARRQIRVTSGGAPFVGKPAVEQAFSVNPKLARFYLRKSGGTHYRATAPAIVVSENDNDSMRQRFIPELSLLIAVGGRSDRSGKSGTMAEIKMAIERNIPVLLLTPAGGEVNRQFSDLRALMDKSYKDEKLRTTLAELNDEIHMVDPKALSVFVNERLPERIENLLRTLMGAAISLRADAEARDW